MSERVKHRIVGILVISSLMIIFLPAALKKSNHNFEKNIKIALKLPNKPNLPSVEAVSDKELFNSANVVNAPKIKVTKVHKNALIAKAEPLEIKKINLDGSNIASINNKHFNKDKNLIKLASNSNGQIFSIQVATFTQKSNANTLIDKLKNNGFHASYNTIKRKNGKIVYQVVVGQVSQRVEAVDLQKKLASTMQLNGFIVQSEVS